MNCFLVCYSCRKANNYSIKESFCRNCGEPIIDQKVKLLVFALNVCGIATERSCEGHEGFDEGYHTFPWVTIYHEYDLEKLELVVNNYNSLVANSNDELSRWKIGFNISARKYWIFPKDNYKRLSSLQKESGILARFIISNFKKPKKGKL